MSLWRTTNTMNEADEAWYEAQFDLFSTQGYKELINKAKEIQATFNNISNVDSLETLWFKKGQLDNLNWIIGWQQAVEETYKELISENAV